MSKLKVKKIKKKTHKATSKKVVIRPGGTSKMGRPASRHNTGKKSMKLNRKKRTLASLSKADYKNVKELI